MRAFQSGARLRGSSTTARLSAWWEQRNIQPPPLPFFNIFFFQFLCCLNKTKCFFFFVLRLRPGNIKSEVIYNQRCRTESKNEVQDSSMISDPPTSLLGNCSSFPPFILLSPPPNLLLLVYSILINCVFVCHCQSNWSCCRSWLLCHSPLVCNNYSCSAVCNGLLQIGEQSKPLLVRSRTYKQDKPEMGTITHAVWWIVHFSFNMFSLFVWL